MAIRLFKYPLGGPAPIFWSLPRIRRILTQLNLLWGVKAFYYDRYVTTDETIEDVNRIAFDKGFLEEGDMLISLAAMPIKDKGMVNTLRVTEIESGDFYH